MCVTFLHDLLAVLSHEKWRACVQTLEMVFDALIVSWLCPYRARYGVQLENGPFQRRTADFLWMMIFGALTLLVCEDLFQAMHLDVVIVAGLCLAFLYSFSLDFFVFLFLWEHFMKSSHLWVFGCWVFILGWIFMPICYNLPYYIYFLLNRYFLLSRSSPFQS